MYLCREGYSIVYWYTSNCRKFLGWLKGIMQPRVQNSCDQATPRKRIVMSHKGVKLSPNLGSKLHVIKVPKKRIVMSHEGVKLCSKKSSWAVKGSNYFLKNYSWAVQGSFTSWMKTYILCIPPLKTLQPIPRVAKGQNNCGYLMVSNI